MLIRDVKYAALVEPILFGRPTGTYYRVAAKMRPEDTHRNARADLTNRKIKLFADGECRIIR